MFRSRRAVRVLLLMGVMGSGAFAAAIPYTINFTTFAGSPLPTFGSFTYDSTAALGSQFASFVVGWDGLTFDLTSEANSPFTLACGPANSSTTFGILSGTLTCPGSPPNVWGGEANPGSFDGFDFTETNGSHEFQIAVNNSPSLASAMAGAAGFYSITVNDTQAPEPSSFILALTCGAFLVRKRMRWFVPSVGGRGPIKS